jgi:signal peptidase I
MYLPRTPRHRLWRRLTALLVGLAALAAGWFFLAPPALGGDTAYVVTNGVSMQPRVHTGDLALVRPVGAYHVGDIAAYRSRTLHRTVLHRIVAVTRHGYIFKGDNNSWRDPEHVTRAQIIGKLWVLAPTLGLRMAEVRDPTVIATLTAIAVVLLFGGAGVHRSRRRRRRGPEPKWRPKQPKWLPEQPGTQSGAIGSSGAVAVAAIALAVCAGIALVAWTAPARRTVPEHLGYRQSGSFAYAATTIPGAVYRTGHATTGQPIFARLAGPVQAQFAYALHAPAVHGLSGTAAMDIVLASQNGWTRTVPLQAPTPFVGTHAAVAGIVHLRRLERLLERVAAATAIPGASFTLTLVPDVHVHGTIAGQPFTAAYSPQLPFTLTPVELAPVLPGVAQGTVPPPARLAPVFHPGANGSVVASASVAQSIGARRLQVPVTIARVAGLIGALIALVALVYSVRRYRRSRAADEPTRIAARYGESIVTVVHSSLGSHGDLVQVKSIEELARLAERYESMIIHEQTDLGHAYLVADGATLYAYLAEAQGAERGLRDLLMSERAARPGTGSATGRGVKRTIPA